MNQQQIIPSRTVITSFSPATSSTVENYDEGQYVLHVTTSPSNTLLSCALSNQLIQTYDRSTLKLLQKYQPHSNTITSVKYINDDVILSSSTDGTCKLYDCKSNSVISTLSLSKEEALTVDVGYNGVLAAVGGSSGNIHFYDLRNISNKMHPLGSYVDAHTDDVTHVKFQSMTSSLLATASEDSLINVFDTSMPSEESALKSVMNTMAPLRQVGFFGPSQEGIFALTGSETLQVWHHDSCQLISDFGDVRNHLSHLGHASIQYLVGCHWSNKNQELNLVAGNTEGDCLVYKVEANNIVAKQKWNSGHKASIRSFVASDYNGNECFITAGEDSRLCEWCVSGNGGSDVVGANGIGGTGQETNTAAPTTRHAPKSGGGVIRRQKKKKAHAPY
ncbi:hypothetical protein CTEN210_06760 [Chaetoceros tenuissimus]|uniref:Uncharacterized protein n=1 Tax=Chaetoceros tenuissimus TaxID=426638 RepID=A0AAD3H548_9STRA|nr:hypothetical protein CTEN210_06760 [Chaetoceros tenuissimus]